MIYKMKICPKCKSEKKISDFNKDKTRKDGRTSHCKFCRQIIAKEFRKSHIKERKEYRESHKKEFANYSKKYYDSHKQEIKNYRSSRKKERNKYLKQKRADNINFKIRCYLGSRISNSIKLNSKSDKTKNLLGCTIPELKQHLKNQFTKGMTWENYGTGWRGKGSKEWHIDHIKPCASFDLNKPKEQRKCFNYTNLQPLWAKDNWSKNAKYNEQFS